MNTQKTETIEDLSPIPYFPYQPGWLEWSVLLFFVFGVSAIAYALIRRPRTKLTKAMEFCLDELNQLEEILAQPQTPKEEIPSYLSKASILVKRLLSNTENTNIASLTLSELKELRGSLKSDSLRSLIEALCVVENTRFQPEIEKSSGSQLIFQLKSSLKEYKEVALSR